MAYKYQCTCINTAGTPCPNFVEVDGEICPECQCNRANQTGCQEPAKGYERPPVSNAK